MRPHCIKQVAFVLVLSLVVAASNWEVSSELVEGLLSNYPKHVRPVKNNSKPITVEHKLLPIQILDVDEKNQILILKVWINHMWYDDFLTWKPEDHGDIEDIVIPVSEIWQPDITLYQSVSEKFDRHVNTDVSVTWEGYVKAPQPMILQSTCSIDATYFPFDIQVCELKFGSWSYSSSKIDIVVHPLSAGLSNYVTNGEWDLSSLHVVRNNIKYECCTDSYPDVTYTLYLRRRPLFYIFNIVLPGVLLFILVLVGFYLPSDCGERMTLFVTSMLALMVFMTIVSANMPPNSTTTPFIEQYYIITIAMVVLSCIVSAWTINIHFQGPACHAVPTWVRTAVFGYLASVVMMRRYCAQYYPDRNGSHSRSYGESYDGNAAVVQPLKQCTGKGTNGKSKGDGCIGNISSDCRKMSPEVKLEMAKSTNGDNGSTDDKDMFVKKVDEWRAVARIIDRAFLFFYIIVFLAITFGYVLSLYAHGEQYK
ncbi:neuronal acetylcholine receptor subunit alpha-3-like [Saccoglossus kowalevskii]